MAGGYDAPDQRNIPGHRSHQAPQTTSPAEAEGTGAHSADRFDARVTNPFVPSVTAATVGEIDGFKHIKTIIPDAEVRFDRLPMSGRSEHEPWSGYYWPKNKGGTSYRWKTGESHTYKGPSMVEVQTMPQSELAKLSPAEKYDLFVGSYNYPLNEAMKSGNKASTPELARLLPRLDRRLDGVQRAPRRRA